MSYITADEYAAWGLPAGPATDTLVRTASGVVDAYCHRSIGAKVYTERLSIPEGRNVARLTYGPFIAWDTADTANPTGVRARYGLGRRGDPMVAPGLLEYTAVFGGPPAWEQIPSAAIDVDPNSGAIWLPLGIYQAAYSEADVRYRAGYAEIPEAVKVAVVRIVALLQAAPPGARMVKAGDRAVQFSSPAGAALPADIAAHLAPYRVQALR